MKNSDSLLARDFLHQARKKLHGVYLPRITRCLEGLAEDEIWARPNPASNSIGNLVLHLVGNVRQWLISGLGGAPDIRDREREFQERGPLPTSELVEHLTKTVGEACRVLRKLSSRDLARVYRIQGFRVTGLQAVFHVTEHFSHHAGQIILATKSLRGTDLKFTHLPGKTKKPANALPAV